MKADEPMMLIQVPKWAVDVEGGIVIKLYVQPNASRTEITGEHGEGESVRLKVRIAAPAVENAANEEVVRCFKKLLGIPASRIELVRGPASRSKDLLIRDLSVDDLRALLGKATRK